MKRTHARQRSSLDTFAAEAVRVVAERSAATLCARLPPNAVSMNAAELRGYVRARAAAAVRQEIDALKSVAVVPLSVELIDRTVHLVMRQHLIELQSPRVRRMAV